MTWFDQHWQHIFLIGRTYAKVQFQHVLDRSGIIYNQPIVRPVLNLSDMEPHWDERVRLTASIRAGKVTATAVLKRFGSMASGDPLYRAGRTLGRLERSIFLCDVLTGDDFRRELPRDLSHG